jgi:hypothetical protein
MVGTTLIEAMGPPILAEIAAAACERFIDESHAATAAKRIAATAQRRTNRHETWAVSVGTNLEGLLPEIAFLRQDMRIRITEPLAGSIDGIQLDRFRVGETYDIGTTLASYLMAVGAAVPVVDNGAGRIVPWEGDGSGAVYDTISADDDQEIEH